ncbi:hypothetical protein KFE25_001701 [Diacronema lutheri]|uniref:Ion transport domain-containing protein n=1 Tax=Diacronema lutheri TaxID=2081491 RepID=A0A8J5XFA1_DIALT|nr:hypothetical protein KFE25_001701 [Diacronema lutheri]
MKVMMKAGRGDTGPPGHHRVHPVRPLPQLLLSVPELADVSLPPEVLTPRSRSRSPSPSRSPRHDSSRRDTFKRAQTYSTFEASKRGWAGLVESRVLRKMVSVKRIYGEKPGLLESELGPRATVAQWARLNRSRPWWRRMVHPNSVERRAIDAMTGFLVVLSVAQVPLQVVLSWWPYLRLSATGVAIFNLAVQTWFAAELVLNLRTGYITRNGTLVMDGWATFRKHVFSGWLLLDVLGVMPVERVGVALVARLPRPAGMAAHVSWRERAMRRTSLIADRVGRFAMRAARGELLRARAANAPPARFAWSALSYRYRWPFSGDIPPTLLAALQQELQALSLVHAKRKADELRRTVSRVDLAGLCHAVSRHARLDELGIQIGREAGALARVVSRHARIDEAGEAGLTLLGSIGRRVASVPARLSELITPPGAPPSCASSRTPQPPHDDLRAAQRARFGGDARARVREWCWLDIYDNPPHTPSASSPAPRAPAPDKGGAERRGDGHGVGPKELALLDGAARADGGDDRATMRSTPRTRRRAC